MSTDDLHLAGAKFLKRETKGLYEPAGSKALGDSAERSSKHNRAVAWSANGGRNWA